jgi:pimeloyl-ACP methyl ester carboxylesterase
MRRGRRAARFQISRRRAEKMLLGFVRGTFRVLRVLPCSLSARWAELIFLKPPRQRRTRPEWETLGRARFWRVRSRGGGVATWRWGKGPAVLLVHGWGGHAARLARFVEPLEAAGFSVIAFDAPGHGRSDGKLCDLSDFVRAIRAVCRAAARDGGPVVGLVGHSLGAAACALALRRGLKVGAAVLLAPIADPEEYTRRFAAICRIPDDVHESMKARLVRRQRMSWQKLRLAGRPRFGSVPLLIFHDQGDCKVPPRHGRAIAATWPACDLVTTRGLGHHKILRDKQVVSRSADFLRGSLFRPVAVAPPLPCPAPQVA